MKAEFENAEIEVVIFEETDVITSSACPTELPEP